MKLTTVILAAGKGSRMVSDKPKVLHCLAGKTLLSHVIEVAEHISEQIIVVYGSSGSEVKKHVQETHYSVSLAEQKKQKGTAHAVHTAINLINNEKTLILYGDTPLISIKQLEILKETFERSDSDLSLLTVYQKDPTGYGRIVRNFAGNPLFIVEEKDADEEQALIKEVNTGILISKTNKLKKLLKLVKNNNAQEEYYLTDVFGLAIQAGLKVSTLKVENSKEVDGVNTMFQLSKLERNYQLREVKKLTDSGVQIADINRVDIRGNVSLGRGCIVDINVVFEGEVTIGSGCYIGPSTLIKDSQIGSNCIVNSHSVIEDAFLETGTEVGPFARVRRGTKTAKNVKLGNFVETKQVSIGENSKINHLSYLGDAEIGSSVNVGAGTITCNYDGVNKNKTSIGNRVFIGSGTQLVAPIKIGNDTIIGAGSTIRSSVGDGCLSLSEKKQKTIDNWKQKKQ